MESAIFQALGAASVCWESLENTGIFDSTRARQIGDELMELVIQFSGNKKNEEAKSDAKEAG